MKILVIDLDQEVDSIFVEAVTCYLKTFGFKDFDFDIELQGPSEINIAEDYEHIFMRSSINPINIFPLPKLKNVIYVTEVEGNIYFIDCISSQIEELYMQDDIIEFLNPTFESQVDIIEKSVIELRNNDKIKENFSVKKIINDIVILINKLKN